jgi:hypothetical protein
MEKNMKMYKQSIPTYRHEEQHKTKNISVKKLHKNIKNIKINTEYKNTEKFHNKIS